MPLPRFTECDLDAFFTADVSDYALSIDLQPIKAEAQAQQLAAMSPQSPDSDGAPTPRKSASSSSSAPPTLADGVVPQRCGYRTGKCQNLQAIKRNGKLHKLCEFHREKANQNQKKLDRKKRLLRYSPYDAHPSSSSTTSTSAAASASSSRESRASKALHHPRKAMAAAASASASLETSPRSIDGGELMTATDPTSLHEAPLGLGCEELAIFFSIMSDRSRTSSFTTCPEVGFSEALCQPFMTV